MTVRREIGAVIFSFMLPPHSSLRAQRSNPFFLYADAWIASLRSQ